MFGRNFIYERIRLVACAICGRGRSFICGGVEKIVAVMLNRGLEVYIARQGILKAGGAFLPMTPDYPDERVDFIVKDSNVRHIVTTRDIYQRRKEFFDALITYPFKTLINCAACVKHFTAGDILTQINVEGVQNLINLCVKKKARLIQISTVSIAGDNVDQKIPMGTLLIKFAGLGIQGAAAATVIANACGLTPLISYERAKNRMLRFYLSGVEAMEIYAVCTNTLIMAELLAGGIIKILSLSCGLILILTVVFLLFPEKIAIIFGMEKESLLPTAAVCLQIYSLSFVFYVFNEFLQTYYQTI